MAGQSARSESRRPRPPFPAQHQRRPGLEHLMEPRPSYRAAGYRGSGKLEGKVALITGGDSGIGRAVAVLFAREGADVAIVSLPSEAVDARETAAAVGEEGRKCLLLTGDVQSPRACAAMVRRTVKRFGRLDVLVNNAAYQHRGDSLDEVTPEIWKRTFSTNIDGCFHLVRAAVPHLPRGGSIINTGSIVGLEGSGHLLAYSSSKGALHAFTKALAQLLVEKGIRVNCVAPGPVWTPLNVADKPARKAAKHGADTPMRRPAQPDEIAPAFVYFASESDSSYVTGEVLALLGGETTAG